MTASEQSVGTLALGEEARRVLEAFNDTRREYPRGSSIHQLFEQQAERTPEAVAVECGAERLTYRELEERANQLGHFLREAGVGGGTPVGLCVGRSVEMVVATLAILKAGGAYVPLEATYPRERLEWMVRDTGVKVVVAQRRKVASLPEGLKVVEVDAGWAQVEKESRGKVEGGVGAEGLAYVMYTSGSTGGPKGVCVPHRAVVRLVKGTDFIHFGPEEVFLQLAPMSFDAATLELWGALLHGARLVVYPEGQPTLEELGAELERKGVTTLWLTAALFEQMQARQGAALGKVRQLLAGGDVLSVGRVKERLEKYGPLVNGYGPTEGTTFTCCNPLTHVGQVGQTVSIGKPIANTQVYVLDEQLRPVPVGAEGELYAGGDGLAWGYLNQPELTAEKFIPNPYGPAGSRLYRTGDLARWLPDGTVEFLGRRDTQVKVRGYRIELREVEAALSQHPAVGEVVVVAREGAEGDKRLVAYAVAAAGQELEAEQLRAYLKERLPEYMVPSAFVGLEALPLTPNGKVDRRALPAPETALLGAADYVAPRTPTEQRLADLWAELLHVERVGIHDDLFMLGGHSLVAAQLVSRVREGFQVELPLGSIFKNPTVATLAEVIQERGAAPLIPSIPIANRDGELPLSFPQEQVWFLCQLVPGNIAYNFQMSVRLEGALDVAVLERVLAEIVRRHELLRTSFPARDGRPLQVIHPPWRVHLPVVDLAGTTEGAPEEVAERRIQEEVRRAFDPTQLPLVRWTLYRLSPTCHVLLHTEHHLVHDGWSIAMFLRELEVLYSAFVAGEPSPLPELRIQFADFAAWQRQRFQGETLEAQLAFWKSKLAGAPPIIELPTDYPRPKVQEMRGADLWVDLPEGLYASLKALCQREGVTFFMMLQAAFLVLMYRYTGQTDLSVGTAVANRQTPDVEKLIGMIVNTIVLRVKLSGGERFSEVLRRVRDELVETYAFQDMPLMTLVKALQPDRDLGGYPLFQVMFSFHDSPVPPLRFAGLRGAVTLRGNGSAKSDLSVVVVPLAEQRVGREGDAPTALRWEYSSDVFKAETVQRMAGHYLRLLEAIVGAPELRVAELPLLEAEERRKVLGAWSGTEKPSPFNACVHTLVEAQVARTPEAVAVTFGERSLTYRELDTRANQLAWHLRHLGVGPEVLVGLCVERSLEMVVGLLAILKAGGAYVPLDPSYPGERLGWMLEDARPAVLLAQPALLSRLPQEHAVPVVPLHLEDEALRGQPTHAPPALATPDNLAYVIYTSGSTGRPKGAGIMHRSLGNHMAWMLSEFGFRAEERVLQKTPLSFDASVWECWAPLLCGGRLVLAAPEAHREGGALLDAVTRGGVTVLQLVPSMLRVLLEEEGLSRATSLRWLFCGGEALPVELEHRLRAKLPSVTLVNLYGPTEVTIDATSARCPSSGTGRTVPIGRPIANTQLYLLDESLQPVPVGVPGELYLGGEGLARGYLRRPELTAERFIPHPFSGSPGARLYRTGDMARYLPDGSVEFLERRDSQVKVRGYRIETGEIEAVLAKHPSVREAVVVVREDMPGDKRLVAYVVSRQAAPQVGELRAFLKERLPEYMVPPAFVALEALPLTPSGKVDRKALPVPEGALLKAAAYVAPRTAVEEGVANLWAQLLRVERVGIHDDFFMLGGHSLLATQLVSRVRDAFRVEVPLRRIWDSPTVEALAQVISTSQTRQDDAPIAVANRSDLVTNIEQLSDAELTALLESMAGEE